MSIITFPLGPACHRTGLYALSQCENQGLCTNQCSPINYAQDCTPASCTTSIQDMCTEYGNAPWCGGFYSGSLCSPGECTLGNSCDQTVCNAPGKTNAHICEDSVFIKSDWPTSLKIPLEGGVTTPYTFVYPIYIYYEASCGHTVSSKTFTYDANFECYQYTDDHFAKDGAGTQLVVRASQHNH